MTIRSAHRTLAIIAVAAIASVIASLTAAHVAAQPKKHRIVYHLDDAPIEKALLALGNIDNNISGVGGREHIDAIELVVNGPALQNFTAERIDPRVKAALERLQADGLTFSACGNTMRAFHITADQLPKGTKVLTQGGVVRLMELQEQGYAYIKP